MYTFDDLTNPNNVPYPAQSYGSDSLNGSLPGQGIEQAFEIDLIPMALASGVDYTAYVSGAQSGGGDLLDPYLAIGYLDQSNQLQILTDQDNSSLFGSDPYIQDFEVPFTGTYYMLVTDTTGGVGDYTLNFSASGPPVFFGDF